MFAARLYSPAQCNSILENVRSVDDWRGARVLVNTEGSFADALQPKIREALIVSRVHATEIYREFEEKVSQIVRPMIETIWGADLAGCEGTQLIRYKAGGHYRAHKDADEMAFANRYFTVLCYLNDDFVGGGTSFPSLRFTAMPIPGKTLIFPSRFLHSALAVEQGEKFAFLTWVCGPVPIRWL